MIDINELRQSLGAIQPEEVAELLDRLEAAEKDIALKEKLIDALGLGLNAAAHERDNLRAEVESWKGLAQQFGNELDTVRAKIAAMEQQKPARLVTPTAYRWRYRGAVKWQYGELTEEVARLAKEHNHEVQALGILPGAQNVPSVPDGWKLMPIEPTQEMINHVIDERLEALVAGKEHTFIDIYKAMLAAAPKPEGE